MDARAESREALLRVVWQEIMSTTPATVRNIPAADRAIGDGAAVDDIVAAMRMAAYETAFRLLFLTGCEHAPEDVTFVDLERGWALMDFDLTENPAGPDSALTGIHEELLMADPSGREGKDFLN